MKQLLCILVCSITLFSCSEQHQKRKSDFQQWIENNGKIKALCTTAMISDLVREVGGEHVDTTTLIEGELDPHSYQLVKGDDEKLQLAQLIFYNGLELEHGPSLHHYLMKNSKALSLGDSIEKHHLNAVITFRGQKDPHIWMDISLWSKAVPFIVQALSQHDPQHALIYQANGRLLQERMGRAHQHIHEIMHEVPSEKRFLVTSHDAFHYFARAYLCEERERESNDWKKRFAAPEGLAPESQLSVKDIQSIIDHLRDHQIGLIFPESNVSKDSIRKIVDAAKSRGLDVVISNTPLYSDAMGPEGSDADSYLKMMQYNARTLSTQMVERGMESGRSN